MGDRNTFGRRLARRLFGERLLEALRERRTSRRTRRSPDRRVLLDAILPAVAGAGGEILWVGCRRYTDDYPAILEAAGARCWTTDIDPASARFGRKGRHRVGDVESLDTLFADVRFDTVLVNGVFGYGVDSQSAQGQAMAAIASVLKPDGTLLLGWNTDKIADPLKTAVTGGLFQPVQRWGLAPRITVAGATHVYDVLRKVGP